MVGAEGRCYAWDTRAQGYGRGEGVAALILKPLDAAIKDGDNVHAVIRDTGLNQDGKTATITSPSMDAQVKLIEACYKRAGLDLSETAYVEAHMTGTKVGDAAEAEALAKTFGKARSADDPVPVGSVKTNVGHTEAVSGLAGVIKTAFALKHAQIAPNTNYKETNSKIKLDEWHLQVPAHLTQWPHGKPLRASINNFGYGGTNAHVILESAPSTNSLLTGVNGNATNGVNGHSTNGFIDHTTNGMNGHSLNGLDGRSPHQSKMLDLDRSRIYVLSAKDSGTCRRMAQDLATYLRQSILEGHEPPASDLAYTLSARRTRLPWMVATRSRSLRELAERLEESTSKPLNGVKEPRLGFVFNGQGAQWYAMGRELITAYPIFGASIQKADQMLGDYGADWSLHGMLELEAQIFDKLDADRSVDELMRDELTTRVAEINLSQPISVALQLCLVDLLRSWGINPSAVTSHSSGEIAAAYSVNLLSFEQALGVVYFRGELALKYQQSSSLIGGMLAAGIGPDQAESYTGDTTGGRVVVACINSPESVTFSGDLPALNEVASRLEKDGLFARKMKVPLAYHSHHMLPMAQEYTDTLNSILSQHPTWNGSVKFASPVTGSIISPKLLSPEHWARNLTNPVRFSEAFESMCHPDHSLDAVVEVGAHSTLSGPIRQILRGRRMPYVSCLKRSTDAVESMQDLVCELVARGYPVNLEAVNSPFGEEKRNFTPNLPRYPWNHSTRYWTESRLTRETRYKRFPPHELVGSPISGVDAKVILPAAAYVTMAIEAVRLLNGASVAIRGFRLRDVNVINALTIPESSDGVEVHTQLRPCNESELDHRGWYEFEISSVGTTDTWIKNGSGFVSAEMDTTNKSSLFHEKVAPREETFFTDGSKVRELDVPSLYDTMRQMNINHGPTFRNLLHGRTAGGKTVTSLSIPDVASETSNYVIHPTTLDTIVQATFGGLPKESIQGVMVLPRSIGSMFVPCDLKRQAGNRLKAFTNFRRSSRRGLVSDIAVASVEDDESSSSFLRMEDFYCQAVPMDLGDVDGDQDPPICSKNHWEPDILHCVPTAVKDSMKIVLNDDEIGFEKRFVRASYHFIYDAVTELKEESQESWAGHHRIFYEWMEQIVALGTSGALSPGCQSWSRSSKGMKQMLNDELSGGDTSGRLTVRVGQQLANIVRGQITPLELMMEDNLLNEYYMDIPRLRLRTYKHLKKIVDLYAVKNPGANVLEIGAGTGGATQTVLEAFGSKGDGSGSLLGHYTFTDASAGFFEAAGQKLAAWKGMVDFSKLDIEQDPVEQSFEEGRYDLIVASMVLHATKSLQKTMSHVRKLLKPGGKLLLLETTQDRIDTQLIFGTLPGWWLSEEPFRKHSPNVSLKAWDEVLHETGFTGADFDIGDCENNEFRSCSLILSTATEAPSYPSPVSIVYTNPNSQPWATQLAEGIAQQMNISPLVERMDEITSFLDKVCIFTAEVDAPFVDGMDEASYNQLQNLAVNSRGVLWLSCGGIIDATVPALSQTQGLLRTLRLEHSGNRFVHLDFEHSGDPWSEDKISHVVHVLKQSFDYHKDHNDVESEYAVKGSILHVPRVYSDRTEDNTSVDLVPQSQPFHQPGRTLVWEPQGSGMLSNLCFTDALQMSGQVPNGMIEVEAKAFGVNFREVMIALGQVDDTLVGHDCAGIVTRLGPETEQSGLQVGDRVCGIAQGGFASSSWAYWTGVAKLPDEMTWEDGAAIPVAYTTAYHCLVRIARLQKGESVLIHAAAGGVGQAAIVVAQHVGAKMFVTCSTEAKRDLLVEKYQVNPTRIFSSRDTSFESAVMIATDGKGVDVILNSLSGSLLKATWSCIARFGRFVEIGKVDLEAARSLDMSRFSRCASYTGVDILQLNEYNGPLTREALTESVHICHTRALNGGGRPFFPIQQYSISDMEKALRQMQSGLHVGKLVLVPREGDQVAVISRPPTLSLADTDATYLIAGGLGGIGRVIALWMIEKGAKNILLVSRNAESHPNAKELVETANSEDCDLQIRNCDVSSESSLVKLVADRSAASLPPIKGVINCAMVLDDTILERMTFEQWQRGVQSKISSSANLHKHLPNLDFFVMLSSITGVAGHVSQANYTAGNTFQDALARHRVASGQPAVTLDLPGVTDVGYVATKDASSGDNRVRARVEALGIISLPISAIMPHIEAAVLRRPQRAHPDDSQVIMGLAPWDQLPEDAIVRTDRRFGTLRLASLRGAAAARGAASAGDGSAKNPTNMLVQALESPPADQARLAAEAVAKRLAVIFNKAAEEIDMKVPIVAHGVDSLVAVELRNWLSGAAKAKISIFEITQSTSLMVFAGLIVERSQLGK
ncbi:MAG: putative PKS/NRPS-like protein biosynthetic cluster [Ramalina farinacea]|uniref:PKS/NRPS-like protein biosynthetic cluster n=1 Tax=Ramalina farinacea TaxID=258253 RepID=A0AA43TUB3_9LECA|nr:putative PKS/NRPS-like protein biosynthetic cluster [Ramalina farinacea]